MKKNFQLSASLVIFAFLLSSTTHKNPSAVATVTIATVSLDNTSANGVTIRYVIRGLDVKTINGVDHGSCLNTSTNPQLGKDGSIKSTGVGGTVDSKGKASESRKKQIPFYETKFEAELDIYQFASLIDQ